MATDPDGDQVKYTFDWGDGTTSITSLVNSDAAIRVFHKWTVTSGSTKTFSLRAMATDVSGADSSWSGPLSVAITGPIVSGSNNPPAAPSVPSGSASGASGTAYSYSTKATDPDGDQVKYTFDWGDGTTSATSLVNSGIAASASHTWTVASGSTKTFSVRAKATDDNGADSTWSSTLSVAITGPAPVNNPPAAPSVPSGSASGASGTAYSYSTKATDPDGDQVKYTFDWGDGTTSATSLVNSGIAASASHTWTVASGSTKTFSVRAKATDDNGADSTWSSTLSVAITGPAPVNNPPAAPSVPSGSTSGASGTAYSYSTKATDPDGDQVKYTFDWGDGTTSATSLVNSGIAASASHTWTVASGSTKTFSVRAKATDDNGADSSWSSTLSVAITGPVGSGSNNPPAAPSVLLGPISGSSGTYYTYTTLATDPDGDQVRYTFDWGDGTTSITSLVSSGAAIGVFHKWTVASGSTKTFSLRAMATDDNGADSSWSGPLSVTITGPIVSGSNNPPAAPSVPSGSASGASGTAYSYSTKATDPDGDQVKYTFDWGDGTTSATSLVNSGIAASASHTWTVASGSTKTFSVRAKATDDNGADSSWSSILSVAITGPAPVNNPPAAPSVPSGSASGASGTAYSYSTKATDPDGDQVKYTFDWGDGTTSATSLVNSGIAASASHTWTVASGSTKTFSVRAKATDDNGADSTWSSILSVAITGPAPVNNPPAAPSVPSGSTSGASGTAYSYSTKATDPDGDQVKYTFDWGDGTTSVTSLVNSGIAASASHTWTVASGSTKTFSVRAKATDDNGADSTWSSILSVTITGPAPVNNPPAAPSVPSGSASGASGTAYSYSTKATDPNGDQVKYTFDWGDGTTSVTSLVNSGIAASASHTWTVASGSTKTFSVRAKATDDNGADSTWSSILSVAITGPAPVNNPPAAPSVPSGSTSGASGTAYSYSTKATDPNGDQVKYTFDWGDGTTSVTSLVNSGIAASASHTWTVASGSTKTFSVRAKATDDNGADSSWSSALSVAIKGPIVSGSNNPPALPSIPDGELVCAAGQTYRYSTQATDPDGDHVKYTFDWGDGTTSTTSLVSSGTTASASHIWTLPPGTRTTVNLRAMTIDEHGLTSAWTNPEPIIVVAKNVNHPPTIPSIPSGPTSGTSGTSYDFSTSSTDPDGDTIKYIFDWGDGSTETGYFPSGQAVTASHSWNVPAGKTYQYSVRALSADYRDEMCPPPYWSDPLIVSITGSLNSAKAMDLPAKAVMQSVQAMEPQTEEADSIDTKNEEADSVDAQTEEADSIDTKTEEADSVDAQTAENESVDTQTEEADSIDAQTAENESIDTQTEEADSIDAQTAENESIDTQTEEADSVDAQTAENESVDTQTEEADSVDAQTAENESIDTKTASPTRRQTEFANLTKLQSPS